MTVLMSAPFSTEAQNPSDITVLRWLQEYVRRRGEGGGRAHQDLPLPVLKEKIARAYRPLVESVARKFLGTGEPLDDLVQEGYLGLLSALEYYDPTKGVRFSTYATHFIGGAIRHFLRDRSRIIREPAWLQEVATRVERTVESLSNRLEREPTSAEVAEELAVPVETVEEILVTRSVFQVVSFEDSFHESAGGEILERLLVGQGATTATQVENRVVVQECLRHLKPFEQQVIYEHYFRNLNQTEIATKLGVSCNYVSVTLRKAVDRVGKLLSEAEVRDRNRQRDIPILDAVTGLYTTKHLLARLEEGISRAARSGMPISLIHFSFHGLPESSRLREEVLAACGGRLRRSIRRMDLAGRGEGDTLLAILAGTGPQVEVAALRLVGVLEVAADEVRLPLQVLAGTAWHPEQGRTAQDLLQCAGAAPSVFQNPRRAA